MRRNPKRIRKKDLPGPLPNTRSASLSFRRMRVLVPILQAEQRTALVARARLPHSVGVLYLLDIR